MLQLIWVKEHRPWHPWWKVGGGREQKAEWGSPSNEPQAVPSPAMAVTGTSARDHQTPNPRLQLLPQTTDKRTFSLDSYFLKPMGTRKPNFSRFLMAETIKPHLKQG